MIFWDESALLELGEDLRGYLGELLRSELELLTAEIDITLGVHGDEMDVSVGHFESEHHLCHLLAGECRPQSLGYSLGKDLELSDLLIFHVEDVIHFPARNHEDMSFRHGVDIEESIELVALRTLIAGNLASRNL